MAACLWCEEKCTVEDGRLVGQPQDVINHAAYGPDQIWTHPPSPHCYFSPDGEHEVTVELALRQPSGFVFAGREGSQFWRVDNVTMELGGGPTWFYVVQDGGNSTMGSSHDLTQSFTRVKELVQSP